jgi:hypothetical protein
MILPYNPGAYFALNSSSEVLPIAQFASGGAAAIDLCAVVDYVSLTVS